MKVGVMQILENISLREFTTFKIGGPAMFFCEPRSTEEMIEAFEIANQRGVPTFVLGLGANVLFSDDGYKGMVIRQMNNKVDISKEFLHAESGATIEDLIKTSLEHNLVGLEDFSGIPSTVGGALYINLHYFDAFISDLVTYGIVFDKETFRSQEVDKGWFCFSYDNTRLKTDSRYVLLKAGFELKKVDDYTKHEAIGRSKEIIRTRRHRYPSEPSAGSVFQNLSVEEQRNLNLPTRSVAYLIDVCGLKGRRVGDAMISHKHANMIVNLGNAKASDVLELCQIIRENVKSRFGVDLKYEIQLVGF